MKTHIFQFCLLICCVPLVTRSQTITPQKQNISFDINNLGDAHVEVSETLPAGQWDAFKSTLGNNPELLKRGMERLLPAYYLDSFNYSEDVMDRKFTLSFRALGMSKINENGYWEVDMQNKNPDITKLSDQHYILTSDMNEQGNLVQQVSQINFPSGSSEVKQDKDAFGKFIFTYSLSPSHEWFDKLLLILGVLFLARGLYLVYRQNKPSKPSSPVIQSGSSLAKS